MEVRYMGFDQDRNKRVYKFEGALRTGCSVTADMALFLEYRVAIQEGPSLCARKLADCPDMPEGAVTELTRADFDAYCGARELAENRRLEARNRHSRPRPSH